MLTKLAMAISGMCLMLGLMSETASAETRDMLDQPDDAPSHLDITRATLRNGADRLSMTVHVRNVHRSQSALIVTMDTGSRGGDGYLLQSYRLWSGYYTLLYRFDRPGGALFQIHCPDLSGYQYSGAASKFTAGFPQRCLHDDAGTMRMTVTIQQAESDRNDILQPTPVILDRG
jgi:hypothetical protein